MVAWQRLSQTGHMVTLVITPLQMSFVGISDDKVKTPKRKQKKPTMLGAMSMKV